MGASFYGHCCGCEQRSVEFCFCWFSSRSRTCVGPHFAISFVSTCKTLHCSHRRIASTAGGSEDKEKTTLRGGCGANWRGQDSASALSHAKCGVVDVEVAAGESDEEILENAYSAIVKPPFVRHVGVVNYSPSAMRVLFFHKLFSRITPSIVFHLKERPQNKGEFAAITGAVRTLSEQGFRLIVDSSTHAAPVDLLTTNREIVFEVDFMTPAAVARVPKYRALFQTLEKLHLVSLVWEVVGGYPCVLDKLCQCLAAKGADQPERCIYEVLVENIDDAENDCADLLKLHEDAGNVLEHFRTNHSMFFEAGKLWLASDTHVFRSVGCPRAFVPKTPAHAFVLRHRAEGRKLSRCSLEELRQLCCDRIQSFDVLSNQQTTAHD